MFEAFTGITQAWQDERSRWTDERIKQLTTLWAEGRSASQIAGLLGDSITRNSVIGKVHRLKLPPRTRVGNYRSGPISYDEKVRRQAERFARRRERLVDLPLEERAIRAAKHAARQLMQKALDDAHRSTLGQEPTGFECTLLELNDDRCRFPKGDPGDPDFTYCGAQPRHASPYCRYHSDLCFQPPQERAPRPYRHNERAA